jgi:tetratricopeptide (TPR) repeat protein
MEISLSNFPKVTSCPSSPCTTQKIEKILNEILSYLDSKNPDKVFSQIQELESLNTSSEVFLKLGHLFYKKNFPNLAEFLYKKILPTLQGDLNAECLFGLGQVYYDLKNYRDCHTIFSIISEFYQDFSYLGLIRLKLAKIQVFFKDFESALIMIKKILTPASICKNIFVEAMVLVASIKEAQGKTVQSLKLCIKALSISKTFTSVSSFCLLLLEKNPKKTEKICRKFWGNVSETGEWSDLCFLRALAIMKTGFLEKALSSLQGLVDSFPKNYFYLEFLGICYLKLAEVRKALECFYCARVIRPDDLGNLKNIAFCFKNLGEKNEALRILAFVNPAENMAEGLGKLEIFEPKMKILDFPTNDF